MANVHFFAVIIWVGLLLTFIISGSLSLFFNIGIKIYDFTGNIIIDYFWIILITGVLLIVGVDRLPLPFQKK